MNKQLTFADVLIQPQYSDIGHRSTIFLGSSMGPFVLELPVISANMRTITEADMCVAMAQEGGMGILHRFQPEEKIKQQLDYLINNNVLRYGFSIGVRDFSIIPWMTIGSVVCIDAAHGHHELMKDMIACLRSDLGKNAYVIAGNIATYQAALDLAEWGADCLKVGIGPGSVCHTRRNTGVGVSQLHALMEVHRAVSTLATPPHVIADGGITCVGDIAKALIYADAVMLGRYLAGTTETPGKVYKDELGQFYKVYSGSASAELKDSTDQAVEHVEGVTVKVPFRGHVKYILREIREGLQSAFSYVGARTLQEFQQRAVVEKISQGGRSESKY